jgi:signal transduction histidine kinase
MKKAVCTLLFLIAALIIKAQVGKADSLLKVLAFAQDDTAKVLVLLQIADSYETNNQDSSIFYLEKSRKLSESLNFLKGMYLYYRQSAIVSFTKGDYAASMEQSNHALSAARQLKDSSLVIAMLNNIGIVYAYLGEFELQLKYTLQVKNTVEAIKDSLKLSGVYHNLANAYYILKQYRKSVDYALLAVQIHTVYKKPNNYINRVYATLAQDYEGMKIIDSALYYYDKAIKASVSLNDKYAEGSIYGYLVNLYADRKEFGKMLEASERSLLLAKQLQSRQMMASSLYNVAYANFFNGNNAQAKKDIHEALEIATKDTLRDELKNSYLILSYIAARDGDFTTFLWAKKKSDSLEQVLLNGQVIKATTELEKKYESETKDKQIRLQQSQLEKRQMLNYALIASAVILLIISFLFYRNYRQRQKIQIQRIRELEKAKQLTAAEAILEGEDQERRRLAKDLHDGLGGMMSGIKYSLQTMKRNLIMTPENQQAFERNMDMLDSSINEMRRVAHNMMPEALVKFGLDTALNDFCSDVEQTGSLQISYQSIGLSNEIIEQKTAIAIYRIVQELINNTMKHASAKSAIVQVSKTNGAISITVEDDGKGFNTAILHKDKGIGWSNIQSRISYLKGKLDVRSKFGEGTSVHIELNV